MQEASTPKRVLRTLQRGVLGAALQFLQAPDAVRRKNRLSARGKRTEARPADVAARCAWRSAPVFASVLRGAPQKSAKRKRQAQRPRPVDETGSCVWRSAPVFASVLRGAPQKSAKRKRNHPQIRISFNSRFPQVIIPSQPPFSQWEQGGLFFHTSLWYARVIPWNPKRGYIPPLGQGRRNEPP